MSCWEMVSLRAAVPVFWVMRVAGAVLPVVAVVSMNFFLQGVVPLWFLVVLHVPFLGVLWVGSCYLHRCLVILARRANAARMGGVR